jgi:hypothetical protein
LMWWASMWQSLSSVSQGLGVSTHFWTGFLRRIALAMMQRALRWLGLPHPKQIAEATKRRNDEE